MQRFFIDFKKDNYFIAQDQIAFQLARVLRYKIGQKLEVVYQDNPYLCEIQSITQKEAKLSIIKKIDERAEPNVKINLYLTLIKKDKFEFAIQKATELGVNKIIPIITQRSMIKINQNNIAKKRQRWNKIIQEAAEQCRRTVIPKIMAPHTIDQIKVKKNLALVCYAKENNNLLNKYLDLANDQKISIFVGPEGGIDEREIIKLKEKGFKTVSLGKRILRSETAVIFVISTIIYTKELGA